MYKISMQPRFIFTFCTWSWALQGPCSLSPRPRASPAIFLLRLLPGFPLHRETKQTASGVKPSRRTVTFLSLVIPPYDVPATLLLSRRRQCALPVPVPSPSRGALWHCSTQGWTRVLAGSSRPHSRCHSKTAANCSDLLWQNNFERLSQNCS